MPGSSRGAFILKPFPFSEGWLQGTSYGLAFQGEGGPHSSIVAVQFELEAMT